MSATFDTIDSKPIRYQRGDVMHAVEGAEVHPGVSLLWPKCAAFDVPAGRAFLSTEKVTCTNCLKAAEA